LKEEIDRVINYLDGSTRKPLLLTTEATLLKPHVNTLLEKGFDSLAVNFFSFSLFFFLF